jgi:hypothetical protein
MLGRVLSTWIRNSPAHATPHVDHRFNPTSDDLGGGRASNLTRKDAQGRAWMQQAESGAEADTGHVTFLYRTLLVKHLQRMGLVLHNIIMEADLFFRPLKIQRCSQKRMFPCAACYRTLQGYAWSSLVLYRRAFTLRKKQKPTSTAYYRLRGEE